MYSTFVFGFIWASSRNLLTTVASPLCHTLCAVTFLPFLLPHVLPVGTTMEL